MKIPANAIEREQLYNSLMAECMVSRSDRIAMYERLRSYYLFGCSTDNNPAIFNKILPQVDLLVSFLFAAETTKYGIVVDAESEEKKIALPKVPALTRRLNTKWHNSDADVKCQLAITWSLVYNSMLIKLIQRGRETVPYLVDPHSFGVLREDMQSLEDQEAFVHTYPISKRALDRLLASHPNRERILANVTASLKPDVHDLPAGVNRIIMSSLPMVNTPSGPGQVNSPYNLIDAYRPKTADESVQMHELWVWDDDKDDYRVATMAAGGICVYDRPNFWLPGDHPFTHFCPNPSYDYFWGQSEVDRVTQLQDAREVRMEQIIELGNRQVKPPTAQKGMWQGITDETNYAAQVFGGGMVSNDPTAEFKTFAPSIPQDLYQEINQYDAMFNEMMGLSNILQSKGESGVRSKGHAAELARLGSARVKKRAFTLEDSLDRIGHQYLKLMQQHDPSHLLDENQKEFTAEQFTKNFTVKVDGHSSSPLFVEDHKDMARGLFEARAIDRKELIEMLDPPYKQTLLEGLKKIEAAEKAAAEAEQKAALAEKGLRAVK